MLKSDYYMGLEAHKLKHHSGQAARTSSVFGKQVPSFLRELRCKTLQIGG